MNDQARLLSDLRHGSSSLTPICHERMFRLGMQRLLSGQWLYQSKLKRLVGGERMRGFAREAIALQLFEHGRLLAVDGVWSLHGWNGQTDWLTPGYFLPNLIKSDGESDIARLSPAFARINLGMYGASTRAETLLAWYEKGLIAPEEAMVGKWGEYVRWNWTDLGMIAKETICDV